MPSDIYEFSDSFQVKILALMARDINSYSTYEEVFQPRYFRSAIHVDLARIIREYYDFELDKAKQKKRKPNPPTVEVLFEEVRKLTKSNKKKAPLTQQYQDTVIQMLDADLSDSEYIKENVIKFGRRSALSLAILESADDLEKGTDDFEKIEDRISKAVNTGSEIEDLGTDYFAEAKDRMELYKSGTDGVRRIPTGLAGVDTCMHGGLGNGELGVVIAVPNGGKSQVLTNIGAGAILGGYNVAHVTLEMPTKQVSKRYDLRLSNQDFNYIKENTSKVLVALNNMQKMNMGKLFIKKFPANLCTVNTIRSWLTKLAMEKDFKPDVIIVDYGDIVQPRRTYSDKRFEMESVYLDLRDMADEFDCPVWTASQANRGALNKKIITIGDLAEAFNKANIADFMMALCRTDEEKEDGTLRFYIAKQRDGIAGITLEGDADFSKSFISVLPPEDY